MRPVPGLLLLLGCSQSPEASGPHQQAVAKLLEFPPEASDFADPQLRSLELVRHEDRDQVMALLPLEPGMTVADVGCGIGWFTFPLAKAVGAEGKVHAVDIEARYREILAERLTDPRFPHPGNVEIVAGEPASLPLAPASLDLALMAQLDFHLVRPLAPEQHVRFLSSVTQAVKPGGTVAVVQWLGARQGATVQGMVANLEDAGLTLEARHDFDAHDSVLVMMERPPADGTPEP